MFFTVFLMLLTFFSREQYAATGYSCDVSLPGANAHVVNEAACDSEGFKGHIWSSESVLGESLAQLSQIIYQLPRTGCRELMPLYEELLSIERRYLKTVMHFGALRERSEFDVVVSFETYRAYFCESNEEHKKLYYLHYALPNILSSLQVHAHLSKMQESFSVDPLTVLTYARQRFIVPLGLNDESGCEVQNIESAYPGLFNGCATLRVLSAQIVETLRRMLPLDGLSFNLLSTNFKKLIVQAVKNNSVALGEEQMRLNYIIGCIGSANSKAFESFDNMIQMNNIVVRQLGLDGKLPMLEPVVKDLSVAAFSALSTLGPLLYAWEAKLITDVALSFADSIRGQGALDLRACVKSLPCASSLGSLISELALYRFE